MGRPENRPQPERDQTDESLRIEREIADRDRAEALARTEENADDVVERARLNADAVLSVARGRADQRVRRDGQRASAPASAVIARERALEDDAVRDERASADDTVRRERSEAALVLSALLPLERDKTDVDLLTERARSDNALANRDDFLGMVSHDLRNLLSGIVLSATLLGKTAAGMADDEETAEERSQARTVAGVERIQRYAARMNRLIADLVDVVSIDAGKLSVRRVRGDAAELLVEAVDAFAHAAAAKGIALSADTGQRALAGDFDHERMLQVLANLITNALKFTPAGGRIVVRGSSSAGELRLSIRDSGCGVPREMLELVFERFWQVGKSDRRGLGLGLYISRCIVEAHGGRIWVESEPGTGSEFHVTIPGLGPS
jgi:signal transduction histidine kinase